MDLPVIFLTALVVGYSGALMPGPLLTMVVAESARRGARVGPLAITGHGILELALLGGLAFGLTQVLSSPAVSAVIGVVGGAVMLWMGGGMALEAARNRVDLGLKTHASGNRTGAAGEERAALPRRSASPREHWLRPVLSGAVVSFSNPYWSLWWATIGAAYVVAAAVHGVAGIAAFFVGHILSDFTWYGFVSVSVAYGRRFLGHAFYRWLIFCCGVFLVGLAFSFIVWGARTL